MRSITISSSGNGGANGGFGNGGVDLMKIKVAARHISYRTLVYIVLLFAFLLPFIFILTALVTLEGVNKCSSLGIPSFSIFFPPSLLKFDSLSIPEFFFVVILLGYGFTCITILLPYAIIDFWRNLFRD